jgi:hypothetical protein
MRRILPIMLGLLMTLGAIAQTDLIISEYVEGWSNNKAIEVYNPTSNAINLKNYRLVRYSNGADVPPAQDDWAIVLPDVSLQPYMTYVCVIDKRDPNGTGQEAPVWEQLQDRADVFLCPDYNVSKTLYHNGDDAVALEKTDGTLVDLFGRWGAPRPAEATIGGSTTTVLRAWTDTSPYFTGVGLGITAEHTLYRRSNVVTGVTQNPAMFNPLEQWDSLSANTFTYLGWHKSDVAPANQTPVFEKETFEFKVWKQAKNGDKLGQVKATDQEGNSLRFYINSGNFIYNDNDVRKTPFTMNRANGEITVKDATALGESQWDTLYIKVSVNDGFSEAEDATVMAILSDTQVGIDQLNLAGFKVYPNPTNSNFVHISAQKSMKSVALLNLNGQQITSFEINTESARINLPIQSSGVYLLKVAYDDQSTFVQRIVKQ